MVVVCHELDVDLHLFFFLMLLLPPRSTLFPYTTLFRSLLDLRHVRRSHDDLYSWLIPPDPRWVRGGRHEKDRKSTRLNSSHANISYAVFCLKKKKKISCVMTCTQPAKLSCKTANNSFWT